MALTPCPREASGAGEGDVHNRELALVIDRQRRVRDLDVREGLQRHGASAGRAKIHLLEVLRPLLGAGLHSSTTRYWLRSVKMVEICR